MRKETWRAFVAACGQPPEIQPFVRQAVRDYARAMRCDVGDILGLPWMAPRMGQNAAAIAYRRDAATSTRRKATRPTITWRVGVRAQA